MPWSTWSLCACGEPIPAGTDQCGPCYKADRAAERAAERRIAAETRAYLRSLAEDEHDRPIVPAAPPSLVGPAVASVLLAVALLVVLAALHIV